MNLPLLQQELCAANTYMCDTLLQLLTSMTVEISNNISSYDHPSGPLMTSPYVLTATTLLKPGMCIGDIWQLFKGEVRLSKRAPKKLMKAFILGTKEVLQSVTFHAVFIQSTWYQTDRLLLLMSPAS